MKNYKTAKEAKANNAKRYFTGKPCVNGHIAERYACNRECVECDHVRKANKKIANTTVVRVVPNKTVRVVKIMTVGKPRYGYTKFAYPVMSDVRTEVCV